MKTILTLVWLFGFLILIVTTTVGLFGSIKLRKILSKENHGAEDFVGFSGSRRFMKWTREVDLNGLDEEIRKRVLILRRLYIIHLLMFFVVVFAQIALFL